MTRYIAPALIGAIGAAILLSLGVWQVQRLEWKRGVLDEIESTISGPPQPLPADPAPDVHRYQPVALDGRVEPEALYVLVSVKRQGAGWRAISAFETEGGRRLLLDRGFLPVEDKDAALRGGPVRVHGTLHWPDDRNSSTPDNDVAGNTWYARDLGPMADALGTEPVLVVARSLTPADDAVTPLPVDTSGIPNDHLQYAITWFSLAAIWLGMTAFWIRRRATGKED